MLQLRFKIVCVTDRLLSSCLACTTAKAQKVPDECCNDEQANDTTDYTSSDRSDVAFASRTVPG